MWTKFKTSNLQITKHTSTTSTAFFCAGPPDFEARWLLGVQQLWCPPLGRRFWDAPRVQWFVVGFLEGFQVVLECLVSCSWCFFCWLCQQLLDRSWFCGRGVCFWYALIILCMGSFSSHKFVFFGGYLVSGEHCFSPGHLKEPTESSGDVVKNSYSKDQPRFECREQGPS